MGSFNVSITGNSPAIKHLTNLIRSAALARDPKMGVHTAEALESLVQTISQTTGKVTIPSGSFTSLVQEVSLTVSSTTIIPAQAAQVGSQLVVAISQDATGGRLIVWGAGFHNAPTDIDTTASTLSMFTFIGRINPTNGQAEWYMSALPITGATL